MAYIFPWVVTPYYILSILHPFIKSVWFFPYKYSIGWYQSFGSMVGHHQHGNNVEIYERYHQDFEIDVLKRQLQQLQEHLEFYENQGKVLDIPIQNLKLLAMMKRRIHFTMLIVIQPVRALHLILVISKTYNEVMI